MLACKLPAMETAVSVVTTDTGMQMRVEVWPSMHIVTDSRKEHMVEYTLNSGIVFVLPRRYIPSDRPNFLLLQLNTAMDRQVQREADVTKIRLQDPVFQDPFVFALMLDYLKRNTEEQSVVTLRRADTELTADEWRNLNELERFVFNTIDRNPYWSGLTDASFTVHARVHQQASIRDVFTVSISPGCLIVDGPSEFKLRLWPAMVNCTALNRPRSLLEAETMQMVGMRYPWLVDFVQTFFIPHNHIQCRIEGKWVRCEAVLTSDGSVRVEPVDHPSDYLWFNFALTRKLAYTIQHYTLAYGLLEEVGPEAVGEEEAVVAGDEILRDAI